MPQFSPDQVTFKDLPGYGAWQDGHAREHIAFVQAFATQVPSVAIFDYNFLGFLTDTAVLRSAAEAHAQVHSLIRAAVGITGVDLTEVDFNNAESFYTWLQYHATEHSQIRQSLGMT